MAEVIALFPLSHVLMPAMPLPVHIFEQRYRQLLSDVRSGPGPAAFGVVCLRSGSEVDSGAGRTADLAEVGTLAEILEVEAYEDGTSDLLTVGSRRFRIRAVHPAEPYLRAEVDWLEELDGELEPKDVTRTRRLLRQYRVMIEELTRRRREDDGQLPRDPALLSYHVAAELPLVPADRQTLLECETSAERLRRAIELLRREMSLLKLTRSICVAPSVLQLTAHPN